MGKGAQKGKGKGSECLAACPGQVLAARHLFRSTRTYAEAHGFESSLAYRSGDELGVLGPCHWRCRQESVPSARPLGAMWQGWDGGAGSLPLALPWSLCLVPDPSVPCGKGGVGGAVSLPLRLPRRVCALCQTPRCHVARVGSGGGECPCQYRCPGESVRCAGPLDAMCGKVGLGVQCPCYCGCRRESVRCARPLGARWQGWVGGAARLLLPLPCRLCPYTQSGLRGPWWKS